MVVLGITEEKKISFGAEIYFVAIIAEILQSALGICNEAEFWISAVGGVDLAVWGEFVQQCVRVLDYLAA